MNYKMDKMFSVAGKSTIITGAGGIGTEIAIGFAELGANVVVIDYNQELLENVKAKLADRSINILTCKCDVTKENEVCAIFKDISEKLGSIDILINTAGIAIVKPVFEMTVDEWQKVMDVNVRGTFITCREAGKHMTENNFGRIVNFSSVRGMQGRGNYAAYATSKGAVNMLTKTLAMEWADMDINVNAVCPSFTLTKMNEKILDDKEMYSWVMSRLPKGRMCSKSNLVGPCVFLCSTASEFITGQLLYVDGGWTAG